MADPEVEAREIVERLPVLTVPCSHCPKVSQHVVPDMAQAANRAIDVIATALRAAREERARVVKAGNILAKASESYIDGPGGVTAVDRAIKVWRSVVAAPPEEEGQ